MEYATIQYVRLSTDKVITKRKIKKTYISADELKKK